MGVLPKQEMPKFMSHNGAEQSASGNSRIQGVKSLHAIEKDISVNAPGGIQK
jgi:hypothetical protein